MVFFECRVSVGDLLEWENTVDVRFEGTCFDQFIQTFNCLASTFAVEGFDAYSFGCFRFRHNAVWIRDAPLRSNRSKRSIGRVTTCGNECGVDPIRCKLAGYIQDFVATTIDRNIRAETFDEVDTVFTGRLFFVWLFLCLTTGYEVC